MIKSLFLLLALSFLLSVSFWFGLSVERKAALINRSESFSTPQRFQAQLGKLNIIKAQGKGCTFLEMLRWVVQEVACYRRRHAAMHVQYCMPGHRGSTEPQQWGGGGGGCNVLKREMMAAITEPWKCLVFHLCVFLLSTYMCSTYIEGTVWNIWRFEAPLSPKNCILFQPN